MLKSYDRREEFVHLFEYDNIPKETIVFGDNSKGEVIGLGKIALTHDNSITNIYLVETLGYNLLSVSQLCGMGYNCLFTNEGVTVFRRDNFLYCLYESIKGQSLYCGLFNGKG